MQASNDSATDCPSNATDPQDIHRPPIRALIVGPDVTMANAINGCCCALEMKVQTVGDTQTACEVVAREEADLLLLDGALGDGAILATVHRVRIKYGIDALPIVVGGDARRLRGVLKQHPPGMVDRVLDMPLDHDELHECLAACRRSVALQRGWRATLDHVSEAVVVIDEAGRVRTWNAAAQRIFQWSAAEIRGQHVRRLMPAVHRERHDHYVERYLRGEAPRVIGRGRVEEALRRDGSRFPIHLAVNDISDSFGLRFVGVIHDLTPEHERAVLRRHALYDPLTALPNRTHVMQRLRQACETASRHGSPFAMLYIDLDHFKPINDTLGHAAGDAVLVSVAQRLRRALAAGDFVGRLGGDEFAVLLIDISEAAHADAVVERLRAALRQPVGIDSRCVHVDASFGIALWGADGQDADALLAAADRAMYRDKRRAARAHDPGS